MHKLARCRLLTLLLLLLHCLQLLLLLSLSQVPATAAKESLYSPGLWLARVHVVDRVEVVVLGVPAKYGRGHVIRSTTKPGQGRIAT